MIALHEALAAVVAQIRALAAQGLGDQETRDAGERESGGVELVELHVGQLGPGLGGQRDAVAGGYGGVGGVGVDLACAAGGDEHGAGIDSMGLRIASEGTGAGQIGGDDAAIGHHKAGDHGPLGEADALMDVGKGGQGAADFGAGGVAVGMQDAGQRMSAFAGAQQLAGSRIPLAVEARAPLDQLGYAERAFGYERLGRGAVNDSIASIYGVLEMERDVLIALHGDGDSALGVVGVGLGHGLLGDHQDIAVAGQLHRRAQPGYARAHHQKVHLRQLCHK